MVHIFTFDSIFRWFIFTNKILESFFKVTLSRTGNRIQIGIESHLLCQSFNRIMENNFYITKHLHLEVNLDGVIMFIFMFSAKKNYYLNTVLYHLNVYTQRLIGYFAYF